MMQSIIDQSGSDRADTRLLVASIRDAAEIAVLAAEVCEGARGWAGARTATHDDKGAEPGGGSCDGRPLHSGRSEQRLLPFLLAGRRKGPEPAPRD